MNGPILKEIPEVTGETEVEAVVTDRGERGLLVTTPERVVFIPLELIEALTAESL